MAAKGGLAAANAESVAQVQEWIKMQLQKRVVPRFIDVWQYSAQFVRPKLTKKQVSEVMRLNKHYQQMMPQQRIAKRARKYRPIITNSLGYMHGDIGFFPLSEHYATPPRYRAGFLVLVDTLSRYTYLEPLLNNRKAPAIIKALDKIIERHTERAQYHIRGLSFDLERSVMSNKVQQYLAQQDITFTAFKLSNSKAKFAENAIKLVRQKVDVLEKHDNYAKPWWVRLPDVEAMLNNRVLQINGSQVPFTPASIGPSNVDAFVEAIQERSTPHYFGQFRIDPSLVQFKFQIGDFVKAKTIVTSSSVLGDKRSTHQLTEETFLIVFLSPYVNAEGNLGIAYLCKDIESETVHEFNEQDLAKVEPSWE